MGRRGHDDGADQEQAVGKDEGPFATNLLGDFAGPVSRVQPGEPGRLHTQEAEDGAKECAGLERSGDVAGDVVGLGAVYMEVVDEALTSNRCTDEGGIVAETMAREVLSATLSARTMNGTKLTAAIPGR